MKQSLCSALPGPRIRLQYVFGSAKWGGWVGGGGSCVCHLACECLTKSGKLQCVLRNVLPFEETSKEKAELMSVCLLTTF